MVQSPKSGKLTRAVLPSWAEPGAVPYWMICVYERDTTATPPRWNRIGWMDGKFSTLSAAQDALYDVTGEHPRPNRGYRIVKVSAP